MAASMSLEKLLRFAGFYYIFVLVCLSKTIVLCIDEFEDVFLCRQCGHEVTKSDDLRNIASPLAKWQRNQTLLGVKQILIQLLENPLGAKFEVITSKNAEVFGVGSWHKESTWFPPHSWKIGVCPRCGQHLGWLFMEDNASNKQKSKEPDTFAALVLDHLISEDIADNLLLMPKMFKV